MSMKVSFELSDRDLRYFKQVMAAVRKRARDTEESEVTQAANRLLGELCREALPEFVEQRLKKLQQMTAMLEDAEWALAGADRKRVVEALAYFAEPEDLIPDCIPGLGYLDDAIMVELVVQELRHEVAAYADFCQHRASRDRRLGADQDPLRREEWLKAQRRQLHGRMRRRRQRMRSARSEGGGRSPFALW
jgi:uncharacterized membrane protein YkvA (DUF1232 family)